MVELIRNLAVSYIEQPECLILVTISMRGIIYIFGAILKIDDIDNQSALSLAQHYDPRGLRTIGILFEIESLQYQGF